MNEAKYNELQGLLKKNPKMDMSTLIRSNLYNRPIIVYTKDQTVDSLMEDLAALRAELRAIGININQITRHFNTYPEEQKKQFYAKIGLAAFIQTEGKLNKAIEIISKLGEKWLSE